MQFHSTTADIDGMAAGGNLPIVEESAQQPVWQEWGAQWRDLYILDRNGNLVTKINLTDFDPSPTVSNGQNYAQLKALFVHAEAIGVSSTRGNQSYVSSLYHDLLHRDADGTGLAAWTGMLDAGISRVQVALDIEQSTEYVQDEVQSLYEHYLHRQADSTGLAVFTQFLAEGGTLEQVAADIVGSPEYYQTRGGGTLDGFLSAAYEDALARAVDPIGQSGFLQATAAGVTRGQVATVIFTSTEYRQLGVERDYLTFLDRQADATGLQVFTTALTQGTRAEVVLAGILGSDEYFSRI
jgi:hypothetical protein